MLTIIIILFREEEKDNDTGAYNFPSHFTSHGQRHNSITKESLLPDSVQ